MSQEATSRVLTCDNSLAGGRATSLHRAFMDVATWTAAFPYPVFDLVDGMKQNYSLCRAFNVRKKRDKQLQQFLS